MARPASAVRAAVDDAVERYRLPGIAVGVVVDGQVQQVELRGETASGSGDAIARDTLFKIASNTKAMTAALLARQVDAGLLAWDDPVVKHLPGFRMHEDWVTREMQVRDLLVHNSGLGPGAGDLMLWPEPNAFTRDEVIAGLAHLKPRWSFRSRYAYDNTLYIVAGEVAAAAGGAPFDVLLRREVFEPLGLDSCRIGEWRVAEAGSVAAPHARRDGGWVARPDGEVVADMPMAAAGGVRCGLDDMLRWVQAWLDPETPGSDGAPWLSQTQREAAWTAHMPMPLSQRMRDWNRSHYYAYGHGWRLTDVDGTAKVSHTGTLSGMYSAVTLLPELGVGFVILINGNAGEARTVLEQALSRHFTAGASAGAGEQAPEAPRPSLVDHYAGLLAMERSMAAAEATTSDASAGTDPARRPATAGGMATWLGRYRDPWFGEVTVCAVDGGVRFASLKSPRLSGAVLLEGERLLVDFDTLGADADAWMEFSRGVEGGSARLVMAKVDPEADFSYDYEDLAFERVGDCS
ncbi:serine hydrolase [Luteimonas terricola]|uniref:serine hydrolase n=1 Tax=Luteimonas terricola TaxID=645597 RepID=UPI001E438833|nr:serine hydrolase [Luteimonas terricola]